MRDFLTVLLQCSVSMSPVTLVYAAILPLLSKRYAPKWQYLVWLVIAAGWIFPFRPRIDLSFLPAKMADIPVTPIQPIINLIPSMADTGGVVNDPATIPLWLVLAAIWILGIVCVVLYHALRHGRFMKMLRRWSEPVTDLESLKILDSLKSEMGIKAQIGLSVCQSITSPMLVGFSRPAILLPPVKIASDELPLILKHELIHFKRHDLWCKALILAATALHWFNPIVYLMAEAAAVQCEISCDALVLLGADFRQRKQYGETIISVVRNGSKLKTALSTNFYGGKRGMKNRISSIMDTKRKKAGVAVLCLALVGIIMTGATLTATANDESNRQETIVIGAEAGETQTSLKIKQDPLPEYEKHGISYNDNKDMLFNGQLVRYFFDGYEIEPGLGATHYEYLNEKGVVDVHTVRSIIDNGDGSIDRFGKLTGIVPYSQQEFEKRDIDWIKGNGSNPTTTVDESESNIGGKTFAEIFETYKNLGVAFTEKSGFGGNGNVSYQGQSVSVFIDEKLDGSVFMYSSINGGDIALRTVYDAKGKIIDVIKADEAKR